MKIALVQLNYIIGDFEGNSRRIIEHIRLAGREGAELAVFAELAVTGYPARDYLEFDDFISRSEECMQSIAEECRDITAIVGGPSRNVTGRGKPLFNSAWILAGGQVKQLVNKSLLPNYDVFDEYRYFEPATGSGVVEVNGTRLAVTICEDIWNTGDIPLYRRFPLDEAIAQNPELIINIAASPFHYNQALDRRKVLRDNALKYQLPVIYVNHAGAQTELIFDGGSMACDNGGNIRETLPFFQEGMKIIETGESWYNAPVAPEVQIDEKVRDIALIHDALVLGIRDYFGKMGFKKAILGLSGGIDSAVTLALAAEALGPQNVHGILLPSEFSSDHSVEDAKALAVNLGCPYKVIPISDTFHTLENTMQPFFKDLPFGLTEENMQARIRMVILMAMANKFGYILLNTSNKSEAAVGYGT
ncbi:MAG TPA: NAD(+) synthase, partial [Lentimicrobium sp.]|nr:NAD(+) synthase [Lentimicrobium sp.]